MASKCQRPFLSAPSQRFGRHVASAAYPRIRPQFEAPSYGQGSDRSPSRRRAEDASLPRRPTTHTTPQATCGHGSFAVHRPPRDPTTPIVLDGYRSSTYARIPSGASHRTPASTRLGLPFQDFGRGFGQGSAYRSRSVQLAHKHGGHDRESDTQLLLSGHT